MKLRDNQALFVEGYGLVCEHDSSLPDRFAERVDARKEFVARILDAVDRHLAAAIPGHLQGEAPKDHARCSSCGLVYWPKAAIVCPACGSESFSAVVGPDPATPPSIPVPTAAPRKAKCGHTAYRGNINACTGEGCTWAAYLDVGAAATGDVPGGGVGPHDWRPYPGMGWECRCGWLRRAAGAGELSTSFEYRPLGKRVWQPVEPSCGGTGRSPGGAGK